MYFDADFVHIQAWDQASLEERAVLSGDPGCPEGPYYGVPCVMLPQWKYWKPNGNDRVHNVPSSKTYVVNGFFNFPAREDPFLRAAARYCLERDHVVPGEDCWNCCGPRAFTVALGKEVQEATYVSKQLRILPVDGVLYCQQAAGRARDGASARLTKHCSSLHIFGGSDG